MRQRAIIHMAGPKGAGKTALIEAILNSPGRVVLAARGVRDDAVRRPRESKPRSHPELRRYRQAGASAAALFEFPEVAISPGGFFETDLMNDFSHAVVIEGDSPVEFADLTVFVAPPPAAGETLLVRRQRDRAVERRVTADAFEQLVRQPDGVAKLLGQMVGTPLATFVRQRPDLLETMRADLLASLAHTHRAPPPAPTEHWAMAAGYAGIERAQLVVINVRSAGERERGEALAREVARLRNDGSVFKDVLGARGTRTPITIVVANVINPKDPGLRKALARVRRSLKANV